MKSVFGPGQGSWDSTPAGEQGNDGDDSGDSAETPVSGSSTPSEEYVVTND